MAGADGPRVLVVGAGILGAAVAHALARAGAAVVAIDRDDDPSAATRASLGVLTHANGGDDPLSSFYRDSHALHAPLARQLRAETGIDVGWRPLGGIDLAFGAEEAQELHAWIAFNQARGARAEWLDERQLRDAEPALSPRAVGGALFADDARVDPERLRAALQAAAVGRGAGFELGTALTGMVADAGGVTCQTANAAGRQTRRWDAVVIAAGSWSDDVARQAGSAVAVRPVRGQSCRFAGSRVRRIVRWGGFHILPADGELLVGGTVEDVGDDAATTDGARRQLSEWAARVLARAPSFVSQRAGLRPKPRKGRPVIGPLPGAARVIAATGHYKNGVLMGPLTGQVVARWIAAGDPGRDMSCFAVRRGPGG